MRLNPYLNFDGNAEAAFNFYAECLGGQIVAKIAFADTPMADKVPAAVRGKLAHIRLMVGDQVLMGSDAVGAPYAAPKGFHVTLNVDDPSHADRVFHALAEGGTVTMPIEKTFWALRFGMLVDRFGTPWMINCEAPR